MPTYDYRCGACGHEFELFQRMSDRPKRKCPECAALKLKRLMGTGAGIIFKGSGFYETDYKRKGPGRNGSASSSSSSSSSSSGETKSKSDTSSSKMSEGKKDVKKTAGSKGKSE